MAKAAKKTAVEESKERKVRISAPELETVKVRIEGITGLIVKAMSAKVIKGIEDSQQGKGKRSTAKAARVPEEEYEDCFHRTADGKYAVRAIWFKKGMENMATFSEGLFKKDVKCGIFIHGDLIPLVKYSEPHMRTDWVRLGGMSKKTSICYRPEFDKWEVDLTMTVDLGILSVDEAINLLSVAGTRNGIGEFRMQTSGNSNGCFRIKTIESGK
jgi:hypothetical protein